MDATDKSEEECFNRVLEDESMQLPELDVVVAGMSGRFPKSDSVNEFEDNLYKGVDMVNDQDNSRFTCGLWNLPPRAGRLKDLSRFDNEFFGFTNDEANYMDFQLRILYEVVYESILDAGLNPAELRGSNTGVFFGLHCNEFENAMADDPNFRSSGYYAQFAIKIAQYYDLHGLTVTFDAACASGFVALHNAVQAVHDGILENAIVCSSNIPVHPTGSFIFLQMQMLSPTGYSRFLDSRADGYVKSESCVSVLIQRKHLALRSYGSFLATLTSVDGYKPEGITFPSYMSQQRLIQEAKQVIGLKSDHIQYLEAHGTGTPAGDPQEARAIASVYCPSQEERKILEAERGGEPLDDIRTIGPLLVGSVKTNMGHSEAASGLCALVKVLLMFEHELIYPSLHFAQPNANIDSLIQGRLKFVDKRTRLWANVVPISCYGFGGSNVHVVVRASKRMADVQPDLIAGQEEGTGGGPTRLVLMYGRSRAGLSNLFDQILDVDSRQTRHCQSDGFLALLEALSAGKQDRMMQYRGYMLLDRLSGRQLARSIRHCPLDAAKPGSSPDCGRPGAHLQDFQQPISHLVFAGLGCEWTGMWEGAARDKCGPFWRPFLSRRLPFEPPMGRAEPASLGQRFEQIVAYQVALIALVRDEAGLAPIGQLVGLSLGEISCAYAAGLIDEPSALRAARMSGEALEARASAMGAGRMLALGLGESEALELLAAAQAGASVRLSCVNGPHSVSVSGSEPEMAHLSAWIADNRAQLRVRPIQSHGLALHNESLMGPPIREALAETLRQSLPQTRRSIRDLAGPNQWIRAAAPDRPGLPDELAEYLAVSLCCKADFWGAAKRLEPDSLVIELGPSVSLGPQLLQLAEQAARPRAYLALGDTRRAGERLGESAAEPAASHLLRALGDLYLAGARISRIGRLNGGQCAQMAQAGAAGRLVAGRGTPSLSSLLISGWNHEAQHFVPRYPLQFSKSSAKSEMPVDLIHERDKYLEDHCVEGRCLFPATGYLLLAWRVFSFTQRRIYDACFHQLESELVPVEFHQVRLLRAVLLSHSRPSQLYVQLEEATGRFEIKEAGSLVAEGYARRPRERPEGLLFEQVLQQLRQQQAELTLDKDDIYRQFRLSGYDYGPKFRTLRAASCDGRRTEVEFNGHFVALLDGMLQSALMAAGQSAPSASVTFLPTRLEYARFQPQQLLAKLRASGHGFDLSDGALSTMAKRQLMNKIMQRQSQAPQVEQEPLDGEQREKGEEEEEEEEEEKEKGEEKKEARETEECVFETFCEPLSNIIISDGIEMRGVRASPVARRVELEEPLLESYQFVANIEEPIEDEALTGSEALLRPYSSACDSLAFQLLARTLRTAATCASGVNLDARERLGLMSPAQLEDYKMRHLVQRWLDPRAGAIEPEEPSEASQVDDDPEGGDRVPAYDIERNGSRTLLSVLDQLVASVSQSSGQQSQLVSSNRSHLMRDLLLGPLDSERLLRPLLEMAIESACLLQGKRRASLLEVNPDEGTLCGAIMALLQVAAPQLALDYTLAQPNSLASRTDPALLANIRTCPLAREAPLHQALLGHQLAANQDLVICKDDTCYWLPASNEKQADSATMASLMAGLASACSPAGFVLLLLRQQLSLAERTLLALVQAEEAANWPQSAEPSSLMDWLEASNKQLRVRRQQAEAEAKKVGLELLASKSDLQGNCGLLFRKARSKLELSRASEGEEQEDGEEEEPLVLMVDHQQPEVWIERLKAEFVEHKEKSSGPEEEEEEDNKMDTSGGARPVGRKVWLCAAASRKEPISGLLGLMQTLVRELGFARLRCFLDEHTFAERDEPVSHEELSNSSPFRLARRLDLLWSCFDHLGRMGSYRHLTIKEQLEGRAESRCSAAEQIALAGEQSENSAAAAAAGGPARREAWASYVNNATRGDLSSLSWFEAPFRFLDETEQASLVRVAYSALNFRDIMLATGRLPLDAIPVPLAQADCLLGLEFSGWDAKGQRVMGMVYGRGLASHLLCPKERAIKLAVPEWMSLREAASIPVAYATAIMALVVRARAQPGESILIHAASGAVGQAAIRLAQWLGLRIYASAGSAQKRHFLVHQFGLSERQVFSSRDCSFEPAVMGASAGRGLDMVLNSLADDKLQASVRCLAPGGRFLEIGKYDMAADSALELSLLDRNCSLHGILLDKLFELDQLSARFRAELGQVVGLMREGLASRSGFVQPIQSHLFQRHQVEQAFRFMAAARHTGKILVQMAPDAGADGARPLAWPPAALRPPCLARLQLDPRAAYLVTGGLGGFGLELVKWLVQRGARHLVISSRSGPRTGYQRAQLALLRARFGARLLVLGVAEADASRARGARLLCARAARLAPSGRLAGLFHLAMQLKDATLASLDARDFRAVCAPKLGVGRQLDLACRRPGHALDHFVVFSSVAAGLGNAGQASYAYANSYLERMCEQRRRLREPGLAVQWGPVGDVGAAHQLLGAGNQLSLAGLRPQRIPSCLATLERLMCAPHLTTCLSVLPVRRRQDGLAGPLASGRCEPVAAVMHVLGIRDPSKVSEQATLAELGLDSLMAVEIRQFIERDFDLSLNIQEIRALTIGKIRQLGATAPVKADERPKQPSSAEQRADTLP